MAGVLFMYSLRLAQERCSELNNLALDYILEATYELIKTLISLSCTGNMAKRDMTSALKWIFP